LNGTSELRAAPGFHLDECDGAFTLDHQIDIATTAAKATLDHPPPSPAQPPLRYSLSELSERLPSR
jgi:hypothetical protein